MFVEDCLCREEKITVGRPLEVDLRRMWDAIFINKTDCQCAYLPHDFPPPTTVDYHYMKWIATGFFERVNAEIRRGVRKKGRTEEPKRRDHRQSKRQGHGGIHRGVGL